MTYSDYVGIAGLFISVLFGLWGVYSVIRRVKYPANLTFVREQSVALLEDFAKKIPNLSVHYKETPIEKNVVLFSGYLVNDGSVDIMQEMTEQPLMCLLPGECSWLEFKVTTAAPALKVESAIVESRKVMLSFGLFRRGESFSFQALVVLDEDHAKKKISDFAREVCWTHRIASLGDIKTIQMPEQQKRSKKAQWIRRGLSLFLFSLYFFYGLSQIIGMGPLGDRPSIEYQLEANGKIVHVKLEPSRDGTTNIKNIETGETEKVNLSEFVKTARFVPIRSAKRDKAWIQVFSGFIILIAAVIILYITFSRDYKRYKIGKLVAASARET